MTFFREEDAVSEGLKGVARQELSFQLNSAQHDNGHVREDTPARDLASGRPASPPLAPPSRPSSTPIPKSPAGGPQLPSRLSKKGPPVKRKGRSVHTYFDNVEGVEGATDSDDTTYRFILSMYGIFNVRMTPHLCLPI
jgi:hypothetical protein